MLVLSVELKIREDEPRMHLPSSAYQVWTKELIEQKQTVHLPLPPIGYEEVERQCNMKKMSDFVKIKIS